MVVVPPRVRHTDSVVADKIHSIPKKLIYMFQNQINGEFGHPLDTHRERRGLCECANTSLVHLLRARACQT